jgi:hypothetical protein
MKICGAPGEIRTPDPLVRSQVLYPTELRARCVKLVRDGGLRPPRRLSQRAAHSKGRREIRPDERLRARAASARPGDRGWATFQGSNSSTWLIVIDRMLVGSDVQQDAVVGSLSVRLQ